MANAPAHDRDTDLRLALQLGLGLSGGVPEALAAARPGAEEQGAGRPAGPGARIPGLDVVLPGAAARGRGPQAPLFRPRCNAQAHADVAARVRRVGRGRYA